MPSYSFTDPRLYVDIPLSQGAQLSLGREQSHYLLNVMRLKDGETVLLFNGRDGEWQGAVTRGGRKEADVQLVAQTRPQVGLTDIEYCFAPLKQARLDYMVQKAVEMGAGRLVPVLTQRTQVRKLNLERLEANVIEAAEQCGILSLAEVQEPMEMNRWLSSLPEARTLVFCDERADGKDGLEELKAVDLSKGISVLIGPEGGFTDEEREGLKGRASTVVLSLGPRILRADTAAVAALTLVQSQIGDWNS